jgi:hypothetical protein
VFAPDKHRMAGKGRIENLRPPWKPGQSGNPRGRPKGRPISDCYSEFADMPLPAELCRELGLPLGATYRHGLASCLFKTAMKGNVSAVREIREGIEGKAGERSEFAGSRDVTFRVVYEKGLMKNKKDPDNAPDPSSLRDTEKITE